MQQEERETMMWAGQCECMCGQRGIKLMKIIGSIIIVLVCSTSFSQSPSREVEMFLRPMPKTTKEKSRQRPHYKKPTKGSTFYERAYNTHRATYRSPYQTYGYSRGGPCCVPKRGEKPNYTQMYLSKYW